MKSIKYSPNPKQKTLAMDRIDVRALPVEIRAKLAELDLELSEGDITQKGYDKKRQRLLSPYIPIAAEAPPPPAPEPSGSQQVGSVQILQIDHAKTYGK